MSEIQRGQKRQGRKEQREKGKDKEQKDESHVPGTRGTEVEEGEQWLMKKDSMSK